MKTLATSNSVIGNNTPPSYFSASSLKDRFLSGGPEFVSYRRPRKLAGSGLQHLVPLRRGGIDLLSCFSPHIQVDTQNDAVENQDTNQSKTVCVKFQLQKECTFGEHFFVVGDDPMFGSWDVTSAIPLTWADGHQWAAEVEIPVGKTIQFKFVLQGETGNVVWQPGPDRTFQPWETTNTIIVSEDWDSAESRILSEEEKIVNQDEDSPIVTEKLMIEENLTYPNKELIHNTNEDSSVALADTEIAENSLVESHKELIDGSNISSLEENGSNVSASEENTSNVSLSEDNVSNISASKENAIVTENIISYPESFILNTSNKIDTKITEEISKNDEEDGTVNILRNTDVQESFIDYGVPILVPGLPPTPTTSNQAAPLHEVKYDINGINEFNDHRLPENIQMNQKQDPDVAEQEMEAKSSYEEDVVQSEIRQEDSTTKLENQSGKQEINDDIFQNDITWGHQTLKKFFSSLRLL